jgi:hypothetical protein
MQLHNKALKATFKLYKDLKTTEPSVSTLLHLFDHMIKPIVLYGCEIWGTLTNATLQKNTDILYMYMIYLKIGSLKISILNFANIF